MDLRTNSDYFPIQHYLTGLYNRDFTLKVQWSLYVPPFYVLLAQCIYVLCGSENKQRLFPYTALTGWFL